MRQLEHDVERAIDDALNGLRPYAGQDQGTVWSRINGASADAKRDVINLIRKRWPRDTD